MMIFNCTYIASLELSTLNITDPTFLNVNPYSKGNFAIGTRFDF